MPVRNAQPWLEQAIRSVLGQSFSDLELVVADDGSNDGSLDVARKVGDEDGRVRIIEAGGVGIVGALEAARRVARAPLLARMDADDVSPPDRFASQVALLRDRPNVTLCGTPVRYFPRSGLGKGALRYEAWINSLVSPEQIERDLFVECPLAHPTFMARANAVAAVGGYRDMDWPEDYDLIFRLHDAGARFARTSGAPYQWREHADRLSRRHPRYAIDAFRRLKVHWLLRRFLKAEGAAGPSRRSVVICGSGPTGKAFQKLLKHAGVSVLAFVDVDARKLGQDINGALVVPVEDLDEFTGSLFLGAVSGPQARGEIRTYLTGAGLAEMGDFVMVA